MKELNPTHENLIQDFAFELSMVETIEDMFPPDSGVREPRRPLPPTLPGYEKVALAAVYDQRLPAGGGVIFCKTLPVW